LIVTGNRNNTEIYSYKDYLDRLKELNLWTLEERRNRADLVELFKMYKGFTAIHF